MANVIKLRKGLDVNLKGQAAKETFEVKKPGVYALMPDDFTGTKPKVVVKEGDAVKVGVKKTGCQGICELGPLVRIQKGDHVLQYIKVQPEDCEDILIAAALEAARSILDGQEG